MKNIKKELSSIQDQSANIDPQGLDQLAQELVKIIRFMEEKKSTITRYHHVRTKLLKHMKERMEHMSRLQAQVHSLNNRHKNKMFHLYERMHKDSEGLVLYQRKLFQLREKVKDLQRKLTHLEEEKGKIASEKDWLKLELDHLRGALKKKEQSWDVLKKQLSHDLSSQNKVSLAEQKLKKKQTPLLNEKHLLQHRINEIEPTFMKKKKDLRTLIKDIDMITKKIQHKTFDINELEKRLIQEHDKLLGRKQQYDHVIRTFHENKDTIKSFERKLEREKNHLEHLMNRLLYVDSIIENSYKNHAESIETLKTTLKSIYSEFKSLNEDFNDIELFLVEDSKNN